MRFACDTGGTFTDLIVEDDQGGLHMYKASTTPADPVKGVLDALALAAADMDRSLADLLAQGDNEYGTSGRCCSSSSPTRNSCIGL